MRISDWSSDVCSSDLGSDPARADHHRRRGGGCAHHRQFGQGTEGARRRTRQGVQGAEIQEAGLSRHDLPRLEADEDAADRSEEHTSELQSLMRISYAVFCLKKKKTKQIDNFYLDNK